MPDRRFGVEIFDADHHLYETRHALTKFLPDRHKTAIEYVEYEGRTELGASS